MSWEYRQPVEILFGNGTVKELKHLLDRENYRSGILICGRHFVENGQAKELLSQTEGKLTEVFSDLSQNPDVEEVDGIAEQIRGKNPDFIVALGGGSVLDAAKAVSVMAFADGSIRAYHGTGRPLPKEHLPVIAVPSTAGTGSEVTCVSVLTDRRLGKKAPIVSDSFYPVRAIVDPELTYSQPPYLTASCGIDVLCHALEGYWSKGHRPICDTLAVHAARLVFEYLPAAYANGGDVTAREKMAEASLVAGLAFSLPKTTSSHACSFPLTNLYGIPHGEACGLTLDYFARINAADPRTQTLAHSLGFADGEAMADAILNLKKTLNLRLDLKDFHLNRQQKEELVRISRHPNLLNNPVEITDDMLWDLYERLS